MVIYVFRVKHESPKNNRFSCFVIFVKHRTCYSSVFQSTVYFFTRRARAHTHTHPPTPGDKPLRDISTQLLGYFVPDNQKTFSLAQTTLGRASLSRFMADQIRRSGQEVCCFSALGDTIAVMLCINSLVWKSVYVPDTCR